MQAISRTRLLPQRAPRVFMRALTTASSTTKRPITTAAPATGNALKPPPPKQTASKQYPLSLLPTGMLLRSLLISTVSSNRFLLTPVLACLSFLCSPARTGFLFNVDRNPILHAILMKSFYNQFCAGETEAQTKATIRQLKDLGFQGIILTYAKETIFQHGAAEEAHESSVEARSGVNQTRDLSGDEVTAAIHNEDIATWAEGTLRTVDLLGKGDILAVKLSGAGPTVTTALTKDTLPPPQMLSALTTISTRCATKGISIIIDAESHHFLKGTLRIGTTLMRKYNKSTPVIYNTYQAYLRETPSTIALALGDASAHNYTLGLKVVRGAYMSSDDRALMHGCKRDTDEAYDAIAQGAVRRELYGFGGHTGKAFPSVALFLASHNRKSLLDAQKLHAQRGREGLETVPVAFGQLHGMSDEVSFSLLSLGGKMEGEKGHSPGVSVYKCSTWGSLGQCLAYLLRRAVENRDAVARTGDERRALNAELWRRVLLGGRRG